MKESSKMKYFIIVTIIWTMLIGGGIFAYVSIQHNDNNKIDVFEKGEYVVESDGKKILVGMISTISQGVDAEKTNDIISKLKGYEKKDKKGMEEVYDKIISAYSQMVWHMSTQGDTLTSDTENELHRMLNEALGNDISLDEKRYASSIALCVFQDLVDDFNLIGDKTYDGMDFIVKVELHRYAESMLEYVGELESILNGEVMIVDKAVIPDVPAHQFISVCIDEEIVRLNITESNIDGLVEDMKKQLDKMGKGVENQLSNIIGAYMIKIIDLSMESVSNKEILRRLAISELENMSYDDRLRAAVVVIEQWGVTIEGIQNGMSSEDMLLMTVIEEYVSNVGQAVDVIYGSE